MKGLRLQTRLVVLSSMLIVASMFFGVVFQVVQAQVRVRDEMQAALDLAWQLVDAVLPPESGTLAPPEQTLLLKRLKNIEAVRHLDIHIVGTEAERPSITLPLADDPAPFWFSRLVQVSSIERRRTLPGNGGELLIRSNAAAETDEAWHDSRNFLVELLVVLVGINLMLYLVIRRWLAPVRQIVATLEHAEQGDFSDQLPAVSLPELRTVIVKLNQLTAGLRTSKAENERLSRLSLQIQEEERRTLARELHDEMGQALSAIKAIAWSLQQRSGQIEAGIGQGAERIGSIAAVMSGHVRTMLGRLRPALLDELGLMAAVQQMVDEWNQTHHGYSCVLYTAAEFAEMPADQQIHVYRIVQEALTNIASHAGPCKAEVIMTASKEFRLVIRDEGKGYDAAQQRPGRGLTGMRERCRMLGGEMSVNAGVGKGVSLVFAFPRLPQAQRGDI